MKDLDVNYLSDLFKSDPRVGASISGDISLKSEIKNFLISDYTSNEIINALKSMSSLKAPGPDGY